MAGDFDGGFDGAKVAVIAEGRVLTLQRDDRAGLPWPGLWDLPGGRREGDEAPEACALRELREELGVALDQRWLVWRRLFPSALEGRGPVWLFVAEAPLGAVGEVRLGDEGQGWAWMGVRAWLAHPRAIGHLQARLGAYLRERAARAEGPWF